MQRILPKFLLLLSIALAVFLNPTSTTALTTKSSVTIRQSTSSNGSTVTQSSKIKVSTSGEGTSIITTIPVNNQLPQIKSVSPTIIQTQSVNISSKEASIPSNANQPENDSESENTAQVKQPNQQTQSLSLPTIHLTSVPLQITSTPSIDIQNFIMKSINDYRRSRGLSLVQISKETCDFAKVRAKEIAVSFNHDGFRRRLNNKTIPYKSWSLVTENLAMTSNYKNVVNMWIASSGHAENMRKDTPFVCVEQFGNYYAYEGMRP